MIRLLLGFVLGAALGVAAGAFLWRSPPQYLDLRDREYVEEAKRIAPFDDQVNRYGEYLELLFSGGRRVLLISSPDGCEGDGCASYFFEEYINPLDSFLVRVDYYESHDYLLIHRRTAEKTPIVGYPQMAPDGQRFVAAYDEMDCWSQIQMWQVRKGASPKLEFAHESQRVLSFVSWTSPTEVEFSAAPCRAGEIEGAVHFKQSDSMWHLIGADGDVLMESANP